MIHADTTKQIRSLMRDIGEPVVRIGSPKVEKTSPSEEIKMVLQVLESGDYRTNNISSISDLVIRVFDLITQRLHSNRMLYKRKPDILESFFIASAADGLLSRHTQFNICNILNKFLSYHKSELINSGLLPEKIKELHGSFSSGDTRTAIIYLCEILGWGDAQSVMAQLNLPFTKRPPNRSPAWSAIFQQRDQPVSIWFDNIVGGNLLFLVYYSKKCAYEICNGCNLPDLVSNSTIASRELFMQTDYVYNRYMVAQEKESTTTIILSNNGSLFDQDTFSHTALLYTIYQAVESLPNLNTVVIETRCEYVNASELSHIRAVLNEGKQPIKYELAIGVEVFDVRIRNKVVRKGLSNKGIERICQMLADNGGGLRCYFMLKPVPNMSEFEAKDDIIKGHKYLEKLAKEYGISILMHLNPTFVSIGTELEKSFQSGSYSPPHLQSVYEILSVVKPKNVPIYIGLNDEGLAVEGGSFIRDGDEKLLDTLRQYNQSGELEILI